MISQIYFATTNQGKIASLTRDLQEIGVEVLPIAMEIPEIRSDETPDIARGKVLYAYPHIKKPCIAQDGGFYIPALGGFPKAYVNFVMGTIGIEGILKLAEDKDRHCEFRDTIAYIDDALDEPILFTTATRGSLADVSHGQLQPHNWGILHTIFMPEGWTKTFSEMTADEMHTWRLDRAGDWCGHQLAEWLKKNRT